MKKINIFWMIRFAIVAILGFWIWCQRPGMAVERVLPSNPLVFGRLDHVCQHVDELISSDFGKNIATIDIPDVLSQNNFTARDVSDFKHWQKDLMKSWDNPVMKRFLGKEASLAVYRQDDSYRIFVVLRLTLSTRIAELVGQLFHHWGDGVHVTQMSYQGRSINHIEFKKQGLGLSYVRIRDLLIIAPDTTQGHLEEVVDVYQQRHSSLESDPSFNFVRQNAYSSGDGLVFINFNQFSVNWRDQMDARLVKLGYQTAAFPLYGLSYSPGVVSKFKLIVGLDQKHMPSSLSKTFDCPALSNDSLKFIPVNAIAYNWGACYDLGRSMTTLKQRLEEFPQFAKRFELVKGKVEKHFDVSIRRDILPILGQEIGGYLTDVDMQGKYPFPRILFFVKILDRPAAERLLERFTQHPVIDIKHDEYQHVGIHYVSLPMGANMDPGYSFLGDYLLIATTRQLLKRSIDAYNDSLRSIVSDDSVGQFSLDTGSKFHSMTLMKTAELSRRAQDFLGWIDKFLSSQVSMAAAYKQDGDSKKIALDEAIADKNAELILAHKKLVELKKTSLSSASLDDPSLINGAIENLSREENSIREDIANYKDQKADLSHLLQKYALGAQSAKLTMYNMDNVLSPFLKGLESIDTQALTVRFDNKILETELLVK